jgi:cytochrome P450
MRHEAPIHWQPPSELPPFWSVTRYADVKAVYAEPETFSSGRGVLLRKDGLGDDPGGGLTMALTDPPRHRQLRSLVAEKFSARSARAREHELRLDVRDVLERALDQRECEFVGDVAAPLAISIIGRLLGVPRADFETLLSWTREAYEAQKPLAAHLPIMQYFIELMFDRMEEPANDVASLFANGTVAGDSLSETEIMLNLENLVGATENAGLSTASGLLALLEHPDQWLELRDDRRLMPMAVEEILRWASSATHSMRTATRTCVLQGQEITAGDRVVLWLPSANRDASVFGDPFRFDITRRPNRHLALGFGEHACIGGSMARAQLSILLSELLDRTRAIEQMGPVVLLSSIVVNGPARLPVCLRV